LQKGFYQYNQSNERETLTKLWLNQGGYAMVIQHNMSAMNTSRQLGLTTGRFAKSSEKLSSGYKINRAADDAAGLSISEKMRKQIRGLAQAGENIEDGISLCQVADGALNETVNILQRMRELAVQSANGTNSASDREYIDMEITQLKNEVDRIAETTNFNNAVYPLNAPITYNDTVTETIGETESEGGNYTGGLLRETTFSFQATHTCTCDGKTYNTGDTITIIGLTTNDNEFWCFKGGSIVGTVTTNNKPNITGNNFKSLRVSDLKFDNDGYIYYEHDNGTVQHAGYEDGVSTTPDPLWFGSKSSIPTYGRFMTEADLGSKKPETPQETQKVISMQVTNYYFSSNEGVNVHAGDSSSQNNKIPVHIVNATCKGLRITELTVATEKSSDRALRLLDDAISTASSYRSAFGAVQNRLEHAQKIDANTSENTQAAESQIRDTDMAAEMVRYSNISILTQSGQSMLAQANQSKQGVLSLIA